MAEEKRKAARHTLQMDERERVRISGVLDVMSFDEEGIMMETRPASQASFAMVRLLMIRDTFRNLSTLMLCPPSPV